MTNEEKHAILDVFEQTKKLEGNELSILETFASDPDPDPFFRSRLPIFLMDFLNTESLSILFKLAKDNDWFVRTEAYDAMGVFPFQEVIDFLHLAIPKEPKYLARSYAIMSWTDVVVLLNQITADNISFAEKQRSTEKNKVCIMSWLYSLSRLGDPLKYKGILKLLNDKNYQVRRRAISLLSDISDETNYIEIGNAVDTLLAVELVPTVYESAEALSVDLELRYAYKFRQHHEIQ